MTYIDILFAIPLAWFAFKGFTKGFIVELAMLGAFLLGIFVAIQFSENVGEWFNLKGESAKLIAFFVTFLVVVVLVYLVGRWADSIAKGMSLGFFNNLLGALFGVLKTAFILSVLVYFVNRIDKKQEVVFTPKIQEKSFLYQPIEKMAPFIFNKLDEQGAEIEKAKESIFSGNKPEKID